MVNYLFLCLSIQLLGYFYRYLLPIVRSVRSVRSVCLSTIGSSCLVSSLFQSLEHKNYLSTWTFLCPDFFLSALSTDRPPPPFPPTLPYNQIQLPSTSFHVSPTPTHPTPWCISHLISWLSTLIAAQTSIIVLHTSVVEIRCSEIFNIDGRFQNCQYYSQNLTRICLFQYSQN